MPRKLSKPSTMKEAMLHLVESCEECGSRSISIGTYNIQEGYKQPKGFFAQLGESIVPADPEEYRKLQEERNKKPEIHVEYYCQDCGIEFEQFYDEATVNSFLDYLRSKYDM